jgi:glycosyltransferase involved in cell wall biosynthesis
VIVHRFDRPRGPEWAHEKLWRLAARQFEALGPDRLWLAATNRGLAARLRGLTGRDWQVTPSLTWYDESVGLAPRTGSEVRVGFVGELRDEKGTATWPALARRIAGARDNVRVVVQFFAEGRKAEAYGSAFAGLDDHPAIQLDRRWLDDAQLSALVASLDVVVLPYDRTVYRDAVSGVFALAAGLGVACVTPAGTWMAEQLAAGYAQGASYGEDTLGAVVEAVLEVADRTPALRADAARSAQAWRKHCSGRTMLTALLDWAERPISVEGLEA